MNEQEITTACYNIKKNGFSQNAYDRQNNECIPSLNSPRTILQNTVYLKYILLKACTIKIPVLKILNNPEMYPLPPMHIKKLKNVISKCSIRLQALSLSFVSIINMKLLGVFSSTVGIIKLYKNLNAL